MITNKKRGAASGIHFGTKTSGAMSYDKRERVHQYILALALFTGISGAFFYMIETNAVWEMTAAVIAVIAVYFASDVIKAKSPAAFTAFVIAIPAFAVILFIWQYNAVTEGLKIICNRLFSVSEKYQLYEYNKFLVNAAENLHGRYISAAKIFISGAAAVSSAAVARKKNAAVVAVIALIIAAVQIYFGVFPPPAWNIFLYSVIAFALVNCVYTPTKLFAVIFAATLAIVAGMLYILYTGSNAVLSDISETIRDYFGEKTERPISSILRDYDEKESSRSEKKQEFLNQNAVGADGNENGGDEYKVERDSEFSGENAGTATVFTSRLWILALLGALYISARLGVLFYKTAKRRAKFNSPNFGEAIDAMFTYAVSLLIKSGVKPINDVYANYFEQIKSLVSPKYAENYLDMVDLWQETVYSEHKMTLEQRDKMKAFLSVTKQAISKKNRETRYFFGKKQSKSI